MNKMKKLLFIPLLFLYAALPAQEGEPGGVWTSVSVEKDITKYWSVEGEAEFRTLGFKADRERIALQIGTDYEILKNLKLGIGYSYLNVYDDYKYSSDSIREHFQNRHRFLTQLNWKLKYGDFTLSLRERAQLTYKDESDRYKANGEINTNRINPDFTWRNRAKLSYNIPNCPVSPSCSFESYFLLNEPEALRVYNEAATDYSETGRFFSKLRYTFALEYKINKRNSVELFGMWAKERGAEEAVVSGPNYYILSDWTNNYSIGVSYNIKL